MKKQTLTWILLGGAALFAVYLYSRRKKGPTSSVEAGPTETITEEEYQQAEVLPSGATPPVVAPTIPGDGQSILDIVKSLKRTPEQKAAALKRKEERRTARLKKRATKKGDAVAGMDDISVLY